MFISKISKRLVLPILAIGLISANAFADKKAPKNKPVREQAQAHYKPVKWTLKDIALATAGYWALCKATDYVYYDLMPQPQDLEPQSIQFATVFCLKGIWTLGYCAAMSEFIRDTWNSGHVNL